MGSTLFVQHKLFQSFGWIQLVYNIDYNKKKQNIRTQLAKLNKTNKHAGYLLWHEIVFLLDILLGTLTTNAFNPKTQTKDFVERSYLMDTNVLLQLVVTAAQIHQSREKDRNEKVV